MRQVCQYSGVHFTLPALTVMTKEVVTAHPIFHADRAWLDAAFHQWQEGEITEAADCRLLFLAMLNSSGHINWTCAADPDNSLVQASMAAVFYTTRWVAALNTPKMRLPDFSINTGTRNLDCIRNWLDIWEGIRVDFDAGYKTTSELEKQREREEMLEKLIKSKNGEASAGTARFAGLLAQWAFEAGNVPENIRPYWREVITAKGIKMLSVRQADIDEMVEHFEETLGYHGSIYSYTLLSYLRDLQKKVATGLGAPNLVDIVQAASFTIIDDDTNSDGLTETERNNFRKIINAAPSEAPHPSNYPTRVAYLRAKISWDMAQRVAAGAAEREAKLDSTLALLESNANKSIVTEDEAEADATLDVVEFMKENNNGV